MEIKKQHSDLMQPIITPSTIGAVYKRDASDTDLLEVITAWFQENIIKQRDGKEPTRKELVELFDKIFCLKIKDAIGMISTATSRKKNLTPFLDKLKNVFETYCLDKDEKKPLYCKAN